MNIDMIRAKKLHISGILYGEQCNSINEAKKNKVVVSVKGGACGLNIWNIPITGSTVSFNSIVVMIL